jgi:hypothetical protein
MELAMAINALLVLAAAGLTTLLPRRSPARPPTIAGEPVTRESARESAEYSAGAAH